MRRGFLIAAVLLAAGAGYALFKPEPDSAPIGTVQTPPPPVKAEPDKPKPEQPAPEKPKPPPKDEILEIEGKLALLSCRVATLEMALPEGVSVIRYELPVENHSGFYLRNKQQRRGLLFQQEPPRPKAPLAPPQEQPTTPQPQAEQAAAGPAPAPAAPPPTQVPPPAQAAPPTQAAPTAPAAPAAAPPRSDLGELSIYASTIVWTGEGFAVDIASESGWEVFEVVPPGREPMAIKTLVHEFEMSDGFMRPVLCQNDGWRVVSGLWQLNQHGGGLPVSDGETASAAFQRAVNPFSVVGYAAQGSSAVFEYTSPSSDGDSYVAEARFFIGPPMQPELAPPPFLIAQGRLDGPQVGFGWWVDEDRPGQWCVCFRTGAEPWQVMESWPERPPRSTWIRVGIGIVNGHVAVPMLDGREVARGDVGSMIRGSFHIHTGLLGQKVELDDVAARPWTRHAGEDLGEPVFTASRSFGKKNLYDRTHDPVEFDYWARGANTYTVTSAHDNVLNLDGERATVRLPLYGDFTYRSMPAIIKGDHRFIVLAKPVAEAPADKLAEFTFRKSDVGWEIGPVPQAPPAGPPVPGGQLAAQPAAAPAPPAAPAAAPAAAPQFTLEWGRRNGSFVVKAGNEWKPLGADYAGPVHLMMISAPGQPFSAELHQVYSKCLWHEFFEQAPSDWIWREGTFGMNLRWACQPGWNFMAGKSPRLASVFSKSAYYGEQVIECYMSLCMTLPAEQQYYIRHDLCMSICTDGLNLDSGYTLIFGGNRNTRTMLLKRGKELASTDAPQFLFPKGTAHGEVHWLWWNFEFTRANKRVIVKHNGAVLFNVEDPDPIEGGHVAFWTVGNGFVVSRINFVAEKRVDEPHKALLAWTGDNLAWRPVLPDGVALRPTRKGVEVTNYLCGGTFAVRTICEADLSKTPILEVPLILCDDAKVNLHIEVDGRPWLVPITAPRGDMEFLLVPSADAAYPFGRAIIPAPSVEPVVLAEALPTDGLLRLNLGKLLAAKGVGTVGVRRIALTIGNSSNTGYLMAGFGGNHAGATYVAGKPRWKPAVKQ